MRDIREGYGCIGSCSILACERSIGLLLSCCKHRAILKGRNSMTVCCEMKLSGFFVLGKAGGNECPGIVFNMCPPTQIDLTPKTR